MQTEMLPSSPSTADQLRPVVITVVLVKIAVFALLMTTINFPMMPPAAIEMASVR